MALTDTQTLEGTPEQLTVLLKKLPHQKQYRLVEVEEKESLPKHSDETASKDTATMALLKSWLEEDATDDPEEIREAEAELLEFKRNMNLPRKEGGMRLHYPEAETQ